jgi:hypothetical protein
MRSPSSPTSGPKSVSVLVDRALIHVCARHGLSWHGAGGRKSDRQIVSRRWRLHAAAPNQLPATAPGAPHTSCQPCTDDHTPLRMTTGHRPRSGPTSSRSAPPASRDHPSTAAPAAGNLCIHRRSRSTPRRARPSARPGVASASRCPRQPHARESSVRHPVCTLHVATASHPPISVHVPHFPLCLHFL